MYLERLSWSLLFLFFGALPSGTLLHAEESPKKRLFFFDVFIADDLEEFQKYRKAFTSTMASQLTNNPKLQVMTSGTRDAIFKQRKMNLADCEKAECRWSMAKALPGMELMLQVNIRPFADSCRISMEIQSLKTGNNESSKQKDVDCEPRAIDSAISVLAQRIWPPGQPSASGRGRASSGPMDIKLGLASVPDLDMGGAREIDAPLEAQRAVNLNADADVLVAYDAALKADTKGKQYPGYAANAWQKLASMEKDNPYIEEARRRASDWLDFAQKKPIQEAYTDAMKAETVGKRNPEDAAAAWAKLAGLRGDNPYADRASARADDWAKFALQKQEDTDRLVKIMPLDVVTLDQKKDLLKSFYEAYGYLPDLAKAAFRPNIAGELRQDETVEDWVNDDISAFSFSDLSVGSTGLARVSGGVDTAVRAGLGLKYANDVYYLFDQFEVEDDPNAELVGSAHAGWNPIYGPFKGSLNYRFSESSFGFADDEPWIGYDQRKHRISVGGGFFTEAGTGARLSYRGVFAEQVFVAGPQDVSEVYLFRPALFYGQEDEVFELYADIGSANYSYRAASPQTSRDSDIYEIGLGMESKTNRVIGTALSVAYFYNEPYAPTDNIWTASGAAVRGALSVGDENPVRISADIAAVEFENHFLLMNHETGEFRSAQRDDTHYGLNVDYVHPFEFFSLGNGYIGLEFGFNGVSSSEPELEYFSETFVIKTGFAFGGSPNSNGFWATTNYR